MAGTRTRLLVTAADQVFASACSYLIVLLVARSASPRDFGTFLLAFAAISLTAAVSRSSLGAVLGMDLPRLSSVDGHALEARSTAAALTLGAAVGIPIAVVGVVLNGEVGPVLTAAGIALPVLLVQDVVRFAVVARGMPSRALLADLIWFVPPAALLVVNLVRDTVAGPLAASLTWLAGLASSVAWLVVTRHVARPVIAGLNGWLSGDRRRYHLAADAAMSGFVPFGNGAGAALVSGTGTTAAVRGGSALFAPLTMLGLSVSLGAVPEARRRRGNVRAFFLWVTAILVAAAAMWSVLLVFLPESVGHDLLGETWPSAQRLFPYFAVEYVGLALWTGATALLRFSDATRTVLRIRLWYAPVTLVAPVVALLATDDARAFAAVLAISGMIVGIAGLVLGLRALADYHAGLPVSTAGSAEQ